MDQGNPSALGDSIQEGTIMIWQLCIQYANGKEKVLWSFKNRETALRWVDTLYNVNGYPLHYAYTVRHL